MRSRPTEAEFEALKRKRDDELREVVREICERHNWDPETVQVHACGNEGCYCACPDGPCQHIWDGPDYVEDCLVSATCSRCGAVAALHDMRVAP